MGVTANWVRGGVTKNRLGVFAAILDEGEGGGLVAAVSNRSSEYRKIGKDQEWTGSEMGRPEIRFSEK
jgi:hypothetical protein